MGLMEWLFGGRRRRKEKEEDLREAARRERVMRMEIDLARLRKTRREFKRNDRPTTDGDAYPLVGMFVAAHASDTISSPPEDGGGFEGGGGRSGGGGASGDYGSSDASSDNSSSYDTSGDSSSSSDSNSGND